MMRYRPWTVLLILLLTLPTCETDFYAIPLDDGDRALCAGQCVPNAPPGWSVPVLLWSGDHESAPGCPDEAPTPPTPQEPPPASNVFATFSRACLGNASSPCASPEETCVPAAPMGFARCIFQDGDVACPAPWTRKQVFYEGFIDGRTCTPCGCGPSGGASCIAAVSVYGDDACSVPMASTLVSSTDPASCVDLVSGSPLGSKVVEVAWSQPGSCPPTGGEPIGDVEPNQPATFCCLP